MNTKVRGNTIQIQGPARQQASSNKSIKQACMTPAFTSIALLILQASNNPALAEGWQEVELLVFSRPQVQSQEQWQSPQAPVIDRPGSIALISQQDAFEQSLDQGLTPYLMLDESYLQLKDQAMTLVDRIGLSPVLHMSWRQPIPSGSQSIQFNFGQDSGADEPWVEGTLNMINKGYIRAELAVNYYLDGPPLATEISTSRFSNEQATHIDLSRQTGSRIVHWSSQQNIKNNLIYYLDHPFLGALLTIRPYEKPAAITPEEVQQLEEQQPVGQELF